MTSGEKRLRGPDISISMATFLTAFISQGRQVFSSKLGFCFAIAVNGSSHADPTDMLPPWHVLV